MTHRDDAPYEVPVEPIGAGRGQARRAGAVAVAIVLGVGGAIGLARLADDRTTDGGTNRASPAVAVALASPGPSASAGPAGSGAAPAPARSSRPRIERLLDIPDRQLEGAPQVAILQVSGPDVQVLDWSTGSGQTISRLFRDVVPGDRPAVLPILAPAGDRLLVLLAHAGDPTDPVDGHLVDADGGVLWSADDIVIASAAIWSADGDTLVAVGSERRWHVVTIGADGTARDRVVRLPTEVLPAPTPIGSLTIPSDEPRTVPLGYSADGRWIYGGVVSPNLGFLIGEFRVERAGTRIERVLDLRVGKSDGLVPVPGTLGGRLVDPISGRLASWRSNPNTTGGPPTVEVREPDSAFAFTVVGDTPVGSAWDDDGSLYVLSADSLIYPTRTALVRIGPDGVAGPPILETGPVGGIGLVGLRQGYAAVAIVTSRPELEGQVVLVDLADPTRTAATGVRIDPESPIIGLELIGSTPRP